MSFSFKQKVVIKRISPDKIFNDYEININKSIKNNGCHFCGDSSKILNFGIPISIKEEEDKQVFEVCGQYCSLICAYKDFLIFSNKMSTKQNIKFCDAEPCFRILSHILYKSSEIPDDKVFTSKYDPYTVSFIFTNPYIVK
jgi:hypothetical protein